MCPLFLWSIISKPIFGLVSMVNLDIPMKVSFKSQNQGSLSITDPQTFLKKTKNVSLNDKGAQEVDQQWINSGAKQCSQCLNKKISLPIGFFLEQTK